MWYVWWRTEVLIGIWWGNLREGDHLGDVDKMILIWIFKYCDGVFFFLGSWYRASRISIK